MKFTWKDNTKKYLVTIKICHYLKRHHVSFTVKYFSMNYVLPSFIKSCLMRKKSNSSMIKGLSNRGNCTWSMSDIWGIFYIILFNNALQHFELYLKKSRLFCNALQEWNEKLRKEVKQIKWYVKKEETNCNVWEIDSRKET